MVFEYANYSKIGGHCLGFFSSMNGETLVT